MSAAKSEATILFRLHHRTRRSARPTGRASIVSPARYRRKSSASAAALAYRRDGSFCRHFKQIVSRSRLTALFSLRGATGSCSSTCRSVSTGWAD